ncbi:hypothetical protein B0H17DRAFT_1216883 [Mycena rosella]|uniref:P-loop containing nucleoside triphosphate hydrolase protein n=1 Tax=Mycena rosella TaxID=1033263 RepID=A0AAD7C357_MYCRO|nr:hypothetical protein B0H17DRAFT_1216883 [Mycena rosella]
MPFKPLVDLDPEKLEKASKLLCELFSVPSLRVYQTEVGQNVLKGISTFLDIPTGGGKTLAFWFPLFYYWGPGNTDKDCQKTILVVGPLTALMQSQALSLATVAITANSKNPDQLFKDVGENKYRIVLVSPEMATSTKFHETVLSNKAFANNIICLDIDEGHCISEWDNDDFRPEFSNLRVLLARLPSGLPVVIGSATMPRDVMLDILAKLRLHNDCACVFVSNAKMNVVLSVRILQHSQDTFADLITLFPQDPAKIQDFLRRNTPEEIGDKSFEFYHRFIAEDQKLSIQNRIEDGTLRAVPTRDALGMGMDFKGIMWGDVAEDEEDEESSEQPALVEDGEQMDREAAVEPNDESEMQLAPKRKSRKAMSVLEARDRRYLLEYMVTKGCRHIPWNKFFGNDSKFPPNNRCCDSCTPDRFPVETVSITGVSNLKSGRRRHKKASEDVVQAVTDMLVILREAIIQQHWPNQYIIRGRIVMSDDIIAALAARAREITTVTEALQQTVRWIWTPRFGAEVVAAIQTCLLDYPDVELQERKERERERNFAALQAMAQKDLRNKLALVFDVKICQIFLALPRKTTWPAYYEIIKEPISIAHIKKYSMQPKLINSTSAYTALWHHLFDNARQFNQPGSLIYVDADFLQGVLDQTLQELSTVHHVPGPTIHTEMNS